MLKKSQEAVFSVEQARFALCELHDACGIPWRRIAHLSEFEGIDYMVLWRFAKLGVAPPKRRDRVLLGLVQRRPRKPRLCPKCGTEIG